MGRGCRHYCAHLDAKSRDYSRHLAHSPPLSSKYVDTLPLSPSPSFSLHTTPLFFSVIGLHEPKPHLSLSLNLLISAFSYIYIYIYIYISLYIPSFARFVFLFFYSHNMLFAEDIWQFLSLRGVVGRTRHSAASFLQTISDSMANTSCQSAELEICRDDSAARVLKFVAMASILLSGVAGVAIPLVGKHRRFLRTDGSLFVAAKAFAAGVILATGFVHMLSSASEALSNPCLPQYPWAKFPFCGFFAMMASLFTLLVDFLGTQYYERKQGLARPNSEEQHRVGSEDPGIEAGIVTVPTKEWNGKVFGEEEGGGMHIVGMHAHAAHHRHNHGPEHGACDGHVREHSHGHGHGHGHGHEHGPGHSHGLGDGDEEGGVRHVVVSQVLELGIVSHSVIIGLSLGVSQSPCTIRPLIAALSFHQFFEGFALGGCISQAQFKTLSATIMACFFAITTPMGIGIGTAIASFYNPLSTGALVTEGILDSMSAGILVYMALVDLIAADFLSKRMSCNFRLQVVSYFMLFLGAGLMSSLAIWA